MARPTTGVAYLSLGLVILGGMVFSVFVTVPAWSQWGATRGRHEEKVREQEEKQTFLANIDARAAELKGLDRDARILAAMFPEAKTPADVAAIVHALSGRTGVQVRTLAESVQRGAQGELGAVRPFERERLLTSGAGGRRETGTRYELKIVARGSYGQVRAFVLDLERSLRFFDVPTLEIVGARSEEDVETTPGFVEARMTLWSYLMPAGPSPLGGGTTGTAAPPPAPPAGAPVVTPVAPVAPSVPAPDTLPTP